MMFRQLPYASVILTIVLSALIGVTGAMLYQAYQGSQQALQEEIRLTHGQDEKLLQRVVDEYLKNIRLVTKDLASRNDIRSSLLANDQMTASMVLTENLHNSPQMQMDALALSGEDLPPLVINNSSIQRLGINLLAHLPTSGDAMEGEEWIEIKHQNSNYHLIRIQAPIISPNLGEVIGAVHAFLLLNDNFLILSDSLDITGADAITLYSDQQVISTIDAQESAQQELSIADLSSPIVATPKGTVQAHQIWIADKPFIISLLKPGKSLETLSQAYNQSLRNGIILAIFIALAAMLLVRYLTNRSLKRLIVYAEKAPATTTMTPAFEGDNFIEFDKLGRQMESMLGDIREQENQLDAIFHNTPSAMFLKSTALTYLTANRRFSDLFVGEGIDVIGKTDADIFPEEEAKLIRETDIQVIKTRQTQQTEFSLTTLDGPRYFLSTKFPMINERGELYAVGGITTDISDKVKAEREAEVTQQVFESAAEAILIYNPDGKVITNSSFNRITGYDDKKARLFALSILKDHPEIDATLSKTGRWQGESIRRKANGEPLPIWLSISALSSTKAEQSSYVAVFSDISELKEAEQKLEKLAHYDNLTSLPNRTLFYDRIESSLARAARNGKKTALLFVDIDRFKQVNDNHGHHTGDQLLVEAARRISAHIRLGDTVARLGGDEFTVILSELDGLDPVQDIARRIQKSLREPFRLDDKEIFSSASIGIAMYPDDGRNAESLLKHADVAMYHVKERGRNDILFFDKAINEQAEARAQLEDNLKTAINTQQLFMVYQPRFNISGTEILSAEALIRWKHPEQGFISPADFIPLAESCGLIVELGRWVLMQACQAAQEWNENTGQNTPVSVNLSARQLHDSSLLIDIENALNQTGLDPSLLELEITETMVIQDMETVISRLEAIRDIGVRLSVDDFGTGYSSLIYLKRLPVSTVKIDKSFIDDVPGSSGSENLVKAVISMSHSLALNVVAEGVETEAQLSFLTENHCDEIQGYLLAKPDSAETLQRLMRK